MSKLYNGKYAPFKDLKKKILYIQRSGVRFSSMFTKEANVEMEKSIQIVVDYILNEKKLLRKKIVELLIYQWGKVHSKYKEAYDTDVKEDIFWYVDSCLEFRGKKDITQKELKDLYKEEKK